MLASMTGDNGNGPQLMERAGDILKLRLLFSRLYSGLKNAYAPVDTGNRGNPSMADHYASLIQTHALLGKGK
jgi:hypothetical protein